MDEDDDENAGKNPKENRALIRIDGSLRKQKYGKEKENSHKSYFEAI